MNHLFFVTLAILVVAASCDYMYRRNPCVNDLMQCLEDPRVKKVTSNQRGASQRDACKAADFLLECVKVCPADFLRSSGIQKSIDQLAAAKKQC